MNQNNFFCLIALVIIVLAVLACAFEAVWVSIELAAQQESLPVIVKCLVEPCPIIYPTPMP